MAFFSSTLPRILLDSGLKSLALLAAAWLVVRLLRNSSAAARHRAWSLGLCGLLLLPMLSLVVPHWRIPVFSPAESPANVVEVATPETHWNLPIDQRDELTYIVDPPRMSEDVVPVVPPALDETEHKTEPPRATSTPVVDGARADTLLTAKFTWSPTILVTSLVALWLAGALAAFATLAYGLFAVWRICSHSRPIDDPAWQRLAIECATSLGASHQVRLLQSPTAVVPFAWGLWRPAIVLPSDASQWPTDRRRVVLLHELAHLARHDVLFQFLGRSACALYWFNPLAWHALRQLRFERELACDDCVLASGEVASAYAGELLEIA